MKRKKIIYFTTSPPQVYGGGKAVFLSLLERIRQRPEFEPVVVCAAGGEYGRRVKALGVRVVDIEVSKRVDVRAATRLARIFRREHPCLIHSHGGVRTNFYAILGSALSGRYPIVATVAVVAEKYDVPRLQGRIYGLVERALDPFITHYIAVSSSLKCRMASWAEDVDTRVSVVYNGVDTRLFKDDYTADQKRAFRQFFSLADKDIVIGIVGRLVQGKGLFDILSIVDRLCEVYTTVKLVIAGDGVLRAALEKRRRILRHSDSVVFTGFQSEVKTILAASDFMVMPSKSEGFPMVVLESMSMGKPVIAYDIEGINEQIENGHDGILVPPGDIEALLEAIGRCASDAALVRSLGNHARRTVLEKYTLATMVAKTLRVYGLTDRDARLSGRNG